MQGNQINAGQQQPTAMESAYATAGGSAQQQPQPQATAPVGGGLRGLMTRGRSPMAKDSNGRVLSELTNKLTEYRDKQQDVDVKGLDIKILPVPRSSIIDQNFSNKISLILFVVGVENQYAYHTLLVASEMAVSAPNRNEQFGGYQVEQATAPRTPATLADEALAQVIRKKVAMSFPQANLFSADWSTVPDNFKLTDEFAIEDLFINCMRACWTELSYKSPDFVYDSLAGAAGDNTAVVSIHFNQDQANPAIDIVDKVGLPIRSEILIDFRSEQPYSSSKDLHTENTANVVEFGKVSAYTTLQIDPVAARQNQYSTGQAGANDTQEYVGDITISNIDLLNKVDLANVLLMISTAFPLLDTNTRPWLRNYLPKHLQHNTGRGGNFRPRDLGSLNYDYKYKEQGATSIGPFNTDNENEFTIENFNYLTSSIIQPGAALSIDIPECGDSTWFLRPFAEANDVPAAHQAIVKAADGLTDGRFSAIFNTTHSRLITVPRMERVLMGYFIDDHGVMKDIRIIDMLYLLNRDGHQDPDIGKKWMATFGGSSDAQLAARAKLIESVVSNVTFTGIAIHKSFTADFLSSLDRAITDTGLKLRNDMSREDARLQIRHAAGLAQSGALMTNFTSGMYTTGGSSYSGGGYRGMTHTRKY